MLLNGPRAAPVVRSLLPVRGRIGAVVTVTGIRFGLMRGAGVVRFGAATATELRQLELHEGSRSGSPRVPPKAG